MAQSKTRVYNTSPTTSAVNNAEKKKNQTNTFSTQTSVSTYKPGSKVTSTYQNLLDKMNQGSPTFNSKYQQEMSDVYSKYKNRQPFEYDMNKDALYQQYANQYKALGNQAMQDTMGNAAQLSGGFGNSYATSAGQQAYNSYLSQLNDIIPQLYSQAYDKYNQEGQDILSQFELANQQYANDFNKYQSDLDQYNQNINQLYQLYNTNAANDLDIWKQNASNNQWALNYALDKQNQAFNQAMQNKEYELNRQKALADIESTKASTAGQKIANKIAKKTANAKEAKDLEDSIYERLSNLATNATPEQFRSYLWTLEQQEVIDEGIGKSLTSMYYPSNKGSNNNNVDLLELERRVAQYGSYSDSNAIENLLRTAVDNGWIGNKEAEKWYKKYHK